MSDEPLLAPVNEPTPLPPNSPSVSDPLPAEPLSPIDPESFVTKERVNELVIQSKKKAYEKGYQAALAALQQQTAQPTALQPPVESSEVNTAESGLSSTAQSTDGYLRQLVQAELKRAHEDAQLAAERSQWEANLKQTFTELSQKVKDAKDRYPDFDEVTKALNTEELADVFVYANGVDNAGDVLYDLGKHPSKIATLRNLPPHLAMSEMKRLSESIRQNQAVKDHTAAPEPLQPLSATYRDVGESTSLRELKRLYTS